MQFGGSTRLLTLYGPATDVEEEWEYSPTDLRRNAKKDLEMLAKESEAERRETPENETERGATQGDGVLWGLGKSHLFVRILFDVCFKRWF